MIGILGAGREQAFCWDARRSLWDSYCASVHRTRSLPWYHGKKASCQEVVHYAYEEGFDLRRLLPAPTNTPVDAGPYITMGMCYASHPDTGVSDVTIHRMCLQGKKRGAVHFFSLRAPDISGLWRNGPRSWAVPADIHQHRRGSGYLPHFLF